MGIKEVAGESPTGDAAVLSQVQADRVAQGLPPTISGPMIDAFVRATIAERAA